MSTTAQKLRYHLPKKSIKSDCPACSPKHHKTLSRYIDGRTGEVLPDIYGRCDREANCGYHQSPYHKGSSGQSYAEEAYRRAKEMQLPGSPLPTRSPVPKPVTTAVYAIPDEVFAKSIGHYHRNQFARLLTGQFGARKAEQLLQRFQIGTSSRWPGACIFWYIDDQGRKRGGQVKLFADDWHTEKYIDRTNRKRAKVDWVHSVLKRRLERAGELLPDWLIDYDKEGDRCPCLFGLPQLKEAPAAMPIAIVESPKTAVVCSAYLPGFIWLATGSKSYLKAERLEAVRGRRIILYPDADAYADLVKPDGRKIKGWVSLAEELRRQGVDVEVSDILERHVTQEEREAGYDLADILLQQLPTVSTMLEQLASPGITLRPDEAEIERFTAPAADELYPTGWDEPDPPGTVPMISAKSFHNWQQQHRHFSTLGAPSLTQ